MKEVILSFFNEASVEELMSTPGCSRKKSDIIISQRPYADWDTLVGGNRCYLRCLMRKETLASCSTRSFQCAHTITQQGQRCGSLSKAFFSSIYCVCEQQRLWEDCIDVKGSP